MLYALLLPLFGFLVLMTIGQRCSRRLIGSIGCATIFISFVIFCSQLFLYNYSDMPLEKQLLFHWISVDGLQADFSLWLDPLSLLMTLIITGVGFLIHVYSIGYMEHEADLSRYFAFLNFFVFAMLLLVLASNVLLLFVGWEGVGLASYLLIGYYYGRPSAAAAATKAFVVNRIGDLGFLLAILLTFYTFGTSDIATMSQGMGQIDEATLSWIALLFLIGAVGKSAQLPLHVWLPDAMEGPTPVSALIHAATMVTAGVYLICRLHLLFLAAPFVLQLVGVIGGVTAFFAALAAIGQTDLKRVLAYSTISQLGYMFLACGAGAFYAAMFHLTTHAFMKALLFLAAGNVIHLLHDETEMKKMGGLAKVFPKTHWLFLIGILALSGVPPMAAFFSKDLILEQEYLTGHETLFILGLVTSLLTGFYLTRAYCLTFLGPCQEKKGVKDASYIMLAPVAILAFFSIVGGFLGFGFHRMQPVLQDFLEEADINLAIELPTGFSMESLLSILAPLLGVGLALWIYQLPGYREQHPLAILRKAFFIDEFYGFFIVRPLEAISRWIGNWVEPKVFDGSIRVAARAVNGVAKELQQVQSGQIRTYVAWMLAGSALLMIFLMRSLHG